MFVTSLHVLQEAPTPFDNKSCHYWGGGDENTHTHTIRKLRGEKADEKHCSPLYPEAPSKALDQGGIAADPRKLRSTSKGQH